VSAKLLADKAKSACWSNGHHGTYIWTAGQRVNPKTNSAFVWKATSNKHYSMKYSNWHPGQPDYGDGGGGEGCVNIWIDHSYKWNDQPCHTKTCFVCELEC